MDDTTTATPTTPAPTGDSLLPAHRRGLLGASTVLVPDQDGRILCVRHTYGTHRISLIGGARDAEENPRATALREAREEIGISVRLGPLAAVDWSTNPARPPIASFVYWAAPLTQRQHDAIALQKREIHSCGYLTGDQARRALQPILARRLTACLDAPPAVGPLELELGRPVGPLAARLPERNLPQYRGEDGVALDLKVNPPAPPPAMLSHADYYTALPRLVAKARLLVRDTRGRILLVRLHDTDGRALWVLPGGTVEPDREAPRQGARREIREELGWDRAPGRLLGLDWSVQGGPDPWLIYIYDGGTTTDEDLARIRLQESELTDWRLVTLDQARELLRPPSFARTAACASVQDSNAPAAELLDGAPAAALSRRARS